MEKIIKAIDLFFNPSVRFTYCTFFSLIFITLILLLFLKKFFRGKKDIIIIFLILLIPSIFINMTVVNIPNVEYTHFFKETDKELTIYDELNVNYRNSPTKYYIYFDFTKKYFLKRVLNITDEAAEQLLSCTKEEVINKIRNKEVTEKLNNKKYLSNEEIKQLTSMTEKLNYENKIRVYSAYFTKRQSKKLADMEKTIDYLLNNFDLENLTIKDLEKYEKSFKLTEYEKRQFQKEFIRRLQNKIVDKEILKI